MIRRVPAFDDEQDCPFTPGDIYQRKLPGLNGRPSFRVTLPPIRQRLGDVTRADVIAEGRHGSTARALLKWKIDWVKEHDRWAKLHKTASDEETRARFEKHYADRYCWVLTVALQDPVLCMAAQEDILSGRTMRGLSSDLSDQYVSSGGIDPYAEAVDRATLDRIVANTLKLEAIDGPARARKRMRGKAPRGIR